MYGLQCLIISCFLFLLISFQQEFWFILPLTLASKLIKYSMMCLCCNENISLPMKLNKHCVEFHAGDEYNYISRKLLTRGRAFYPDKNFPAKNFYLMEERKNCKIFWNIISKVVGFLLKINQLKLFSILTCRNTALLFPNLELLQLLWLLQAYIWIVDSFLKQFCS